MTGLLKPLLQDLLQKPFGNRTAPWSPDSIEGLLQHAVEGSPYVTIDGQPYLPDVRSGLGSTRLPLPGIVAEFDGTDDYARTEPTAAFSLSTLTSTFWINATPNGLSQVIAAYEDEGTYPGWAVRINASNNRIESWDGATWAFFGDDVFTFNTPQHVAVSVQGTQASLYINGVFVNSDTISALSSWNDRLYIGANPPSTERAEGRIHDIRIYNVAKTPAEIVAIYAGDYDDPDRTGLVAGWHLSERAGTTAYDWSGNGNHLTVHNADTSLGGTFWVEDSTVANSANSLGYTEGAGGLIIPAVNATTDAIGNPLDYTGQAPHPVATRSPVLTLNGTDEYVDFDNSITIPAGDITYFAKFRLSELTGSIRYLMGVQSAGSDGGRFIRELGDGRIQFEVIGDSIVGVESAILAVDTWYSVSAVKDGDTIRLYIEGVLVDSADVSGVSFATELSNFTLGRRPDHASLYFGGQISDVSVYSTAKTGEQVLAMHQGDYDIAGELARYPFQEGAGTTVYDVSGNGNHGTIINANTAAGQGAWANKSELVEDHCYNHGGRILWQ